MKCKITIEVEDQKSVWTSDNLQINNHRDVIKKYELGERLPSFKPGDSFLNIFSINPTFIPEESLPVPTVEEALKTEEKK